MRCGTLGLCATATERQELCPRSQSIVVAHTTRRNGTRRSSRRFVRGEIMVKGGNVENARPIPTLRKKHLRRLWNKIKTPDACWEWDGYHNNCGYANTIILGAQNREYLPHRLIFAWFKHDIPKGMTIDHLCNNRGCLNPDHMELATQAANVSRALKRKYCKRGHAQTPNNRYTAPGSGRSRCRPCLRKKNTE